MQHQRRRAEYQADNQQNPLGAAAFLSVAMVVFRFVFDGHAVLDAVADRLNFLQRIVFFARKAELLRRKIEAHVFIAVRFRDRLLDFARAVGAVEIFEYIGVFHCAHSNTWSSPISMIFLT